MKRSVVLALVVGLTAGSLVPQAAAAPRTRSRTDVSTYQQPPATITASCGYNPESTCVEFQTFPRDAYVSVEIVDATGLPIPAFIWQLGKYRGKTSERFEFCGGATDAPVPIDGGHPVVVWLNPGATWAKCGPIPATQGTVTATFTTGADQ